jgi:hypothetical protein
MPAFRYRLIDGDGSDLGPFVSSHPHWQAGGLIPHVSGYLRIVAVVEPETEETLLAYLVVSPFDSSD